MESVTCYICKETKEWFEFNQSKFRKLTNTGTCKKCHSHYNSVREQNININKYPEKYMSCDDCDRNFNRYKLRGIKESGDRTTCVFCKSENINSYV